MPDYYGTGRQPEKKKSYVGLAVTLLAVLLAASVLPFVIPHAQRSSALTEQNAPEERTLTLPQRDAQQRQITVCGMTICELDDYQQRYWDLPNGVIVCQVEKNGAAEKAGVQAGDVIIRVGDAKPDSAESCRDLLSAYADGEQAQLELYRCGEVLQIELICRAE